MIHQASCILTSPTICETNKKAVIFITSCSLLGFLKPTLDPHTLSQNWYDLPVGCCWNTFVKRVFDRFLSWDLIWQTSPVLERQIGLMFANDPGDRGSIPDRVIPKTQKMVLDAALLSTQLYWVLIKGKVEQSREWSSALPYTSVL